MAKLYTNVNEVFYNFPLLYGNKVCGQEERYQKAFDKFKSLFNADNSYIVSSSGRVEVLGNHTDHNGGKVVSAGISLDTLGFFLPTNDNLITVKSEGYPEVLVDINNLSSFKKESSQALVCGVAVGLINAGFKVGGFNAYLTSNVLGGAGISSSASYEVLIAEIFNVLYNDGKISPKTKAIVSKFAENEYFGKPCGLLDQTAIAFGGLKELDFSVDGDLSVKDVKCDLADYSFVLVNTGGSHADLTDEFASIPREMKLVAKAFDKNRLIEITEEEFYEKLPEIQSGLSERSILRAIHFFNENKRVDKAINAINSSNYDLMLDAINGSGDSSMTYLQNCYVAGGEQLIPKAVAISKRYNPFGATRVHGGGFAGCVLNVVKNENLQSFIDNMSKVFGNENLIVLSIRYVGTIAL